MTARYAIYYAPPDDGALWRFGSGVLGYDAASGQSIPSVPLGGLDSVGWSAATEEPRRYGFHGTLKAPFGLAEGCDLSQLRAAARMFAAGRQAVLLDGLQVAEVGRFIALVPAGPSPALSRLAFETVAAFERFRAPLTDDDRLRRTKGGRLSPRQTELLDRFGYPYVAEEFRFHMTLTGALDDGIRAILREALAVDFAGKIAPGPLVIDRVAIFEQPDRSARFRIVEAIPLG